MSFWVRGFFVIMMNLVLVTGMNAKAQESAVRTLRFQDGVTGYKGTVDLEIWAVSPHTCLNGNPNASSDADNDGGESQVLLRFDGIVGSGENQIPPGSAIHSAQLRISAFDEGTTVYLHRILVPWKSTSTWASLAAGISADGQEAFPQKDGFTFGKISASVSSINFEVTDAVQAWADGRSNHGWVYINTGGNGWDFYTSEFDDVRQRPQLEVNFTAPKAQSTVRPVVSRNEEKKR